ncbi:alpha/beta hydrolase [Nocardioides sp. KR10-350]|uniref:alpha/beta hydrolase n=1 Tax=Nocardioides cheoyonin TaxID=3156615 RepID=UPI0032B4393B
MTIDQTVPAAWDEPVGGTPRGTLIVLPGRGETATTYQRFGTRLSADAYKVRLVPLDLADVAAARAEIEKLIADESLPSPTVLIGTDTGATVAATLADELDVDAAVVVGLALPASTTTRSWEEEVDARTACPVHRRVIDEDPSFGRGSLGEPLPDAWSNLTLTAPDKPVLVIHGSADPITPADDAIAPYAAAPMAQVWRVDGGRHDLLNDLSHRSVAATIVLFLESLRLGPDLPPVLTRVDAAVRG